MTFDWPAYVWTAAIAILVAWAWSYVAVYLVVRTPWNVRM